MSFSPIQTAVLMIFVVWGWLKLALPTRVLVLDTLAGVTALIARGNLPEKLAHLPVYADDKLQMIGDILGLSMKWNQAYSRLRLASVGAGTAALVFAGSSIANAFLRQEEPGLALAGILSFGAMLILLLVERRREEGLRRMFAEDMDAVVDTWHARLTERYSGARTGDCA